MVSYKFHRNLIGTQYGTAEHQEDAKHHPFSGQERCQEAFECLIRCLTSPSILGYPDFQLPFTAHVHASRTGLGAALYQTQKGMPTVIAYGSMMLSPAERNYSAYRREFLALKWAVASLAVFYFKISYRCGKANRDADGLSRFPVSGEEGNRDSLSDEQCVRPFLDDLKPLQGDDVICSHESFQAVYQAYSVDALGDESAELSAVEAVGARPEAAGNDLPADPFSPEPWHLNLVHNWVELQRNDPSLAKVLRYLKGGQPPAGSELKRMLRCYILLIGIALSLGTVCLLRRRLTDRHETFQLILPAEFRNQAVKGLQDNVGHPGKDCTLDLVRSRFYWSFMATHIERYVAHCGRCIRRKAPDLPRAPMKSFIA